MEKECRKCHKIKPIKDFQKRGKLNKNGFQAYQPWCKTCINKRAQERYYNNKTRVQGNNRKYRYGVTNEQYQQRLRKINYKCELCGADLTDVKVDHCHKTGIVRGLLCSKCNMGLGLFNDDTELLKKAIDYITNPPWQPE